jgi:hypothetical protein
MIMRRSHNLPVGSVLNGRGPVSRFSFEECDLSSEVIIPVLHDERLAVFGHGPEVAKMAFLPAYAHVRFDQQFGTDPLEPAPPLLAEHIIRNLLAGDGSSENDLMLNAILSGDDHPCCKVSLRMLNAYNYGFRSRT